MVSVFDAMKLSKMATRIDMEGGVEQVSMKTVKFFETLKL